MFTSAAYDLAVSNVISMSKIKDETLSNNLLWSSANDLASKNPSVRRRAGPNKISFWIGLAIGVVGFGFAFAAIIPALIAPTSPMGSPHGTVFSIFAFIAVAGFMFALWAGPDSFVRVMSDFARRLNFVFRFGKIVVVLGLSAFSLGIFIWLAVEKITKNHFIIVAGITVMQIIAIAIATSAMRDSVPWVRLSGKRGGIETHSWTLFLWFFSYVVFAIGAVMLVARLQSGFATASATLTIAVLLFTTVIRYRVSADGRREDLQTSLATIHRLLISPRTSKGDSDLLEVAAELEVVLTSPSLIRFSLPHQPAMEHELRVCLFFALLNITRLPLTEVNKADGQFLKDKIIGKQNLREATAGFAWLLRDQLLHASTFIKNTDVYRLPPGTVFAEMDN